MHAKYNKRSSTRWLNDKGVERGRREDVLGERQLTAPVTLTVTLVRGPSSTPIATLSTTAVSATPTILPSSTTTTTPLSISIPVVSLSTDSPPSPSPTSVSPTTGSTNPLPIPSVSSISDVDGSTATSDTVSLSPGAIAGIVVGCLIVLLVAVLVGLRKRTVRNRLKLRGIWIKSKAMRVDGALQPTPYTYDPQGGAVSDRAMTLPMAESIGLPISARPVMNGTPTMGFPQPLPSAYGADFGVNNGAPSPHMPVLYSAIVARAYVPSLPDELSISTGEILKVLQEYDDGWAECMSLGGSIGMVPLECFEKRSGDGMVALPSPIVSIASLNREELQRNSKRFSSLPGARR